MADYSESCDIQDQRVAEYCKFLDIRMFYIYIYIYICNVFLMVPNIIMDRPNHLLCHFMCCVAFPATLSFPM